MIGHTGGFFGNSDFDRDSFEPKSGSLLQSLYRFVSFLRPWEVEEIEAVRSHSATAINTLQYIRMLRRRFYRPSLPFTLQQLLHDLDLWQEEKAGTHDHLIVAELRVKEFTGMSDTLYYWAQRTDELSTVDRARMSARHGEQWGWCIWSEERLARCGLLLDDGPAADQAYQEVYEAMITDTVRFLARKWTADLKAELEALEKRREEET